MSDKLKFSNKDNVMKNIFERETPKRSEPILDNSFPPKKTVEKMKYGGMPEGGRGLEDYERKLMFKREDLEGKDILDLGSGPTTKLDTELKNSNISANLTSFSPHFSNPENVREVREANPDGQIVSGLGENLPFKEESFDVIIAYHLDNHVGIEESRAIFCEIAKTLKPGGWAKWGPVYDIPSEAYKKYNDLSTNQGVVETFEKYGVTIEVEDVPVDIIPKQKVKDGWANAFYVSAQNIVLRKKEEDRQ